MISPTQGVIYLADQRGCTQTEWHRSYHTFNYGNYFREHRKPFGNLQVLNDDTLKESVTINHLVPEDSVMLLLPIVGACECKSSLNALHTIDVGQSCIFFASSGLEFEISNPYKNELINYLLIGLAASPSFSTLNAIIEFDLDKNKNKLVSLFSELQENPHMSTIWLGKFDGRQDGVFALKNPTKGIFVFVIEGAFEVQNRLLQARDGLAIWDSREIEFEALSNDAIILLAEDY